MTYVALLRGINVGGNNRVWMTDLKKVFESVGCKYVKTYINSGNVLFSYNRELATLHQVVEDKLFETFGFLIRVLIVDGATIQRISSAIPATRRNDETMRCDVMFLWVVKNSPDVIHEIVIKPGIDHVTYVDGALIWSVARSQVSKSGIAKIIGTDLYKKLTIRNCNTVQKLANLAAQQELHLDSF